MAISLRASGSWAELTADGTVAIPGAPAAGDRMFLWVGYKQQDVTLTVSGWTNVNSFADGVVASGNGSGSMRWQVFYRDWQSGDANPTADFTGTPLLAQAVIQVWQKDATEGWNDPGTRSAAWASSSSQTVSASASATIADASVVMAGIAIADDSATFTRPTTAIDVASGITWNGNHVESPATHASTTTGNDMSCDLGHRFVTTGGSTITLRATATLSAAETGAVVWVIQSANNKVATPPTAALTLTPFAPRIRGTYAALVIADGAAGYWRFGETSGTVAVDEIGTNNGTYTGATLNQASLLTGDYDTAALLNGSTGRVRMTAISIPSSVTWEIWANVSSWPTDTAFIGEWDSNVGSMLYTTSGSGAIFMVVQGGFGLSTPQFSTGARHHLVGTYDGTNGRLYVDGVLVAGPTALTGPITATPGVALEVGTYAADAGANLAATVDEAAYFPTALSAAKIAAHYSAGSGTLLVAPTAALTLATFIPTVTVAAAGTNTTVTPATATLTTATFIPVIKLVVIPPTATLTLTVFAPTIAHALIVPGARLAIGPSYYRQVIDDAPAAYYRLNESSGTPKDAMGVYDATSVGGTLTYGDPGAVWPDTAITFDADYVEIAHAAALHPSAISFEAWVKRASTGLGETHMIFSNGAGDAEMYFGSDDKLRWGRVGIGAWFVSTAAITDTSWHHIVAVKSGADIGVAFDGTSLAGTDDAGPGDPVDAGGATRIGADLTGANQYKGSIGQVAIYGYEIALLRAIAHYAAAPGGLPPVIKLGVIPPTAALTLTSFAPTVTAGAAQTATPTTATLTVTPFAPVLQLVVTPATASLTLATFIPPIGRGVVPATAALTLTPFAPTVTASDHQLVTPTTAALTISTFASAIGRGVVPATAALTVTTFAPSVATPRLATPTTATLTVTTFAPVLATTIVTGTVDIADTFTRSVTDGWGTADAGGAWTLISGTASEFDVDGSKGTINVSATGTEYNQRLTGTATDFDVSVKISTDKGTTGDEQQALVSARHTGTDAYRVVVIFAVDDSIALRLDGMGGIAGPTTVGGLTHAANTAFRVRLQVQGSTIRARIWLDGSSEPGTWDITATDTSITGPGSVQLGAWVGASTSNLPIVFAFDELSGSASTALALTSFAPTASVSAHKLVTPSTASLTIATFAPTVSAAAPQLVIPTTEPVDLTTFAPTVTVANNQAPAPGRAALTLTVFAPTVTLSVNQLLVPTNAALTLTRFAPTISTTAHQTVTPSTATLTISAFAPTATSSNNAAVTVGVASLSLATFAPTVSSSANQRLIPTTATLTLTTFAPAGQAFVVTPTTAQLSVGGIFDPATFDPFTFGGAYPAVVTVAVGQTVTPATRALTLTTFAPTVSATVNQLVTPVTATLTLTTFAPVMRASIVVPVAALTLTTFTPTVTASVTVLVTPATATLTTASFAPVIARGIIPATASLTLTAFAPSVTTPQTVTVPAAALVLTTFAPSVTASAHITVTPTNAALVLTRFAPTAALSDHQLVTPTTAALLVSGFQPSVSIVALAVPATATLTITTFAPSVSASAHQTVTPATATLTLTRFAPTAAVSDNKLATPTTATLIVSAFQPSVTTPLLATPATASLALTRFAPTVTAIASVTVTPSTATLIVSTFAPSVTAGDAKEAVPGVRVLTLTTFAPTVSDHKLVTPSAASLTLTTFAPSVSTSNQQVLTPTNASLTLTRFAPTVTATAHIAVIPTTASLTLTTFTPTVVSPRLVIPTTAALVLTDYAPAIGSGVVPTTAELVLTTNAAIVATTGHQTLIPPTATLFLVGSVLGEPQRVIVGKASLVTTLYAPRIFAKLPLSRMAYAVIMLPALPRATITVPRAVATITSPAAERAKVEV